MMQEQSGTTSGIVERKVTPLTLKSLCGHFSISGDRLFVRVCLALIAIISVHDAALIVVNHELMMEFEENPIGLWLLQAQGGDVWVFVAVKLLGTSLVITFLAELFRIRKRIGLICSAALAGFQLMLLSYLSLG